MNPSDPKTGLLEQLVQLLGFEVAGMHENLVFISGNPFMLKAADDAAAYDLYFNEEMEEEKAQALMAMIAAAGEQLSLPVTYKGVYNISQNDDQTLSVEFFDLTDE